MALVPREGADEEEFRHIKKARRSVARRPAWGNVYNYDVMHGDYLQLIDDEDSEASFLGECEIFYDYMDEVLSVNEDDY